MCTSRAGIPLLMDIPYLGYLFSTESKSVKSTELLVVGQCSYDAVPPVEAPGRTPHYRRGQAKSISKKSDNNKN